MTGNALSDSQKLDKLLQVSDRTSASLEAMDRRLHTVEGGVEHGEGPGRDHQEASPWLFVTGAAPKEQHSAVPIGWRGVPPIPQRPDEASEAAHCDCSYCRATDFE
mmetsp:Transcript_56650/g.104873  ORF Transcript_56650/g.104873 Transcript_56650/m.104873 type:complete len:106 (+) Transcript_56650:175-492(+)